MPRPPRMGCKDGDPKPFHCLVYLSDTPAVKDTYLEGTSEVGAFNLGKVLYPTLVKVVFFNTGNEYVV